MQRSNEGMSVTRKPFLDRLAAGSLLAVALVMEAAQARATAPATDKAATAATAHPATPASQSVVINLIRLLVQEGVLTQDKANALIRQAEDEADAAARGQTMAVNAPSGAPKVAAGGAPAAPQSVRVPYIPEIVRKQI